MVSAGNDFYQIGDSKNKYKKIQAGCANAFSLAFTKIMHFLARLCSKIISLKSTPDALAKTTERGFLFMFKMHTHDLKVQLGDELCKHHDIFGLYCDTYLSILKSPL